MRLRQKMSQKRVKQKTSLKMLMLMWLVQTREVKNMLPFFSANCLTENGVVMASTKAAGDMDQVKSLPVGIHPEPV
ncbi:hypothetical protein N301_06802, partial [Charadrius vociferus]